MLTRIFSICFVHGLTGDAESTWTARDAKTKQEHFWPTHFLDGETNEADEAAPHARIMLYRYATKVHSLCWLTERTLYYHANRLIDELSKARENCADRPLLFVAHCLGGLLIKNAIVFSRDVGRDATGELSPSPDPRDIYLSTCGIISFGTPGIFGGHQPLMDTVDRLCHLELSYAKLATQYEDFELGTWRKDVQLLKTRLDLYKPIGSTIPEIFCYESNQGGNAEVVSGFVDQNQAQRAKLL